VTGCVTGAADGAADRGEAMRWKMVVEGRDNIFHNSPMYKNKYCNSTYNEIILLIYEIPNAMYAL